MLHTYIHIDTYLYTYMHVHINTCIHLDISTYVHIYTHHRTYRYMHIYTCMIAYIHAYIQYIWVYYSKFKLVLNTVYSPELSLTLSVLGFFNFRTSCFTVIHLLTMTLFWTQASPPLDRTWIGDLRDRGWPPWSWLTSIIMVDLGTDCWPWHWLLTLVQIVDFGMEGLPLLSIRVSFKCLPSVIFIHIGLSYLCMYCTNQWYLYIPMGCFGLIYTHSVCSLINVTWCYVPKAIYLLGLIS